MKTLPGAGCRLSALVCFAIASISIATLSGCARPYKASFVMAIMEAPSKSADPSAIRLNHPPEIATHIRMLESEAFWRKYVEPRLNSSSIDSAKARNGFSVSSARAAIVGRDLAFEFEIQLEVGAGEVFSLIRNGYGELLAENARRSKDAIVTELIAAAGSASDPRTRAASSAKASQLQADRYVPRILSEALVEPKLPSAFDLIRRDPASR